MKQRLIIKFLLCTVISVSLLSCVKSVPVPDYYEKITFDEFISRLRTIRQIKGTADISMKTKDVYLSGMASMKLSPNGYEVKVFSLGIPVGEFGEYDGRFYNTLKLKPQDGHLISLCIKEGLFWWNNNVKNVINSGKQLVIKQPRQDMILDKESLKPIEQFIYLSGDATLHIVYEDVRWVGGIWYPDGIVATLGDYKFTIAMEDVKFER
ncbi:MAG: hypothetical protein H7844_02780 [Nitrospirae bacterium YQR-1]